MKVKSISTNRIKQYTALKHKKFRQKYNKFLAEGEKICSTLLANPNWKTETIIVTEPYISDPHWSQALDHSGIEVLLAKPGEMKSLSQLSTAPGIMAIVDIPEFNKSVFDNPDSKGFYLDGIKDPGNLGTILRTADWFGLDFVICSSDCVDIFNSKAIQSTMGSIFHIPVYIESFEFVQKTFPADSIVIADGAGTRADQIQWGKVKCIVIGSESQGVSEIWRETSLAKVAVAGAADKYAESLNAGVAAGILAFVLKEGVKNHS